MNYKAKLDARLIGSALLGVLLISGCASPQSTDPQTTMAQEQAQIRQRLQEVLVAAETKDFPRLDSYHLYGPRFTKFSGSAPERLDAAAGRKGEHDGLSAAQGLKMRADALQIDVFDRVGIATFILDYRFESRGELIQRRDRSTLVFVKEGGEWRIVHEHLSPINR